MQNPKQTVPTGKQMDQTPKIAIRAETCQSCLWARPHMQQPGHYECRRYPPQAEHFQARNMANQAVWGTYTAFPVVQDACWCGEWRGDGNGEGTA